MANCKNRNEIPGKMCMMRKWETEKQKGKTRKKFEKHA